MEEIRDKKKLNKRPLLICLAIALVFAVIGFIDIKSNAAESETSGTENVVTVYLNSFRNNEGVIQLVSDNKFVIKGNEDIEVYYYQSHSEPTTETSEANYYVASKYPFTVTAYSRTDSTSEYVQKYDYNISVPENNCGVYHWYDTKYYDSGQYLYYHTFETDYANTTQLNTSYGYDTFLEYYLKNELDEKVDYNSLEVDNDMLVPTNMKRNVMTFVDKSQYADIVNPTIGQWFTYSYDYITWTNTSSAYHLQLEIVPIVQYYHQPLIGGNRFIEEFIGEWKTVEVFESVTNSYEKITLLSTVENEDEESYLFYEDIVENYDFGLNGKAELFFGYRIRYADVENEKVSPWVTLMPSHSKGMYVSEIVYSDDTITDLGGADGTTNIYDVEDTTIEDAKNNINIENEFKDKYDVVDSDIDVQEATNWLYSVVNFIKGTPQVVGSVLGFLPQPILYGMYVCIFLGIIASGLAIVKALL